MTAIAYRICFFVSIFCLFYSCILLWQRYNPWRLSFQSFPPDYSSLQQQSNIKPIRITIPSVKIDTAISPAVITNRTWETSTEGASWLLSSPIPGNRGNSIIYGHNWFTILGKLVQVKPGDTIKIEYSDQSSKQFTVQSTAIVPPNQINILAPTTDTRITMYTCTGFLDRYRFVATALVNTNTK